MRILDDPRHAQPAAAAVSIKPISPQKSRLGDPPAETRSTLKFPHIPIDAHKALEARQNSAGE